MPVSSSRPFRLGVLVWNQYTDWPAFRDIGRPRRPAGLRPALDMGPPLPDRQGSPEGPILEGYTAPGRLGRRHRAGDARAHGRCQHVPQPGASSSSRSRRLDLVSNGRAVLGIGGAWFETEHTAFGIDFGTSVGDRLNRLDESVDLMRTMLHEEQATARGEYYHAKDLRNDPQPIQPHLPIVIGGGGEQKTLRTVARYADMWNVANADPGDRRAQGRDPARPLRGDRARPVRDRAEREPRPGAHPRRRRRGRASHRRHPRPQHRA